MAQSGGGEDAELQKAPHFELLAAVTIDKGAESKHKDQ
jgi:hypothetical protein